MLAVVKIDLDLQPFKACCPRPLKPASSLTSTLASNLATSVMTTRKLANYSWCLRCCWSLMASTESLILIKLRLGEYVDSLTLPSLFLTISDQLNITNNPSCDLHLHCLATEDRPLIFLSQLWLRLLRSAHLPLPDQCWRKSQIRCWRPASKSDQPKLTQS